MIVADVEVCGIRAARLPPSDVGAQLQMRRDPGINPAMSQSGMTK